MRPPRLLIWLFVGLAAVLAAGLAVASAEVGENDAAAPAVMLQPGDNFVGWIEESITAGELFETIPEIEVICFWDAATRTWRIAAPSMPSSLWTLRSIEPGMAILARNGSHRSVPWIPQTEPARGRVELYEGTNWVSWAGPSGWNVDQVAKGIGTALIDVRSGDQEFVRTVPGSANDWGAINRGDSLQVTVGRPVNWLQPTYVMPTIEFPGGVSARLQEQVRDDLRAVLDFYARTWGIQADHRSTILVPRSFTALIQRCREVVCTSEQELALRAQWNRAAGWAGWKEMVVKQDLWGDSRTGRYVLSHEYAHWLQYELGEGSTPIWLLEGTASWADELHRATETNQSLDEWRNSLRRHAAQGPSLESAEKTNSLWQYSLGALAVDTLTERAGIESPFELYRSLQSVSVTPGGSAALQSDWRGAFADAFGISHHEFYREFEELHEAQPGQSAEAKVAGERVLQGELVRADGSTVSDGWVTATPLQRGVYVHWARRSNVEADGSFQLFVPSNTEIQLRFDLGDESDCTLYIGHQGGVTDASWEAGVVQVGVIDPIPLRVEIPVDACGLHISGRLTDEEGNGIAHVSLMAVGTSITQDALSNDDGKFRIPVPRSGSYRIASWSQGCLVYFSAHGVTGDQESADTIEVTDRDVEGLRFRLSGNPCRNVISGRLVTANGEGIFAKKIFAQTDGANPAFDFTDRQGYFSISVPKGGSYFLYSPIARGCWAIYRVGTATGRRDQATYVPIDAENVDGVRFVVPVGLCSIEISGRVLTSNGEGASNVRVHAGIAGLNVASGASGRDGSFTIPVTETGSYYLNIYGPGCSIYLGASGPVTSRETAEQITVPDAGVTGIEFRLPESLSTFCN